MWRSDGVITAPETKVKQINVKQKEAVLVGEPELQSLST